MAAVQLEAWLWALITNNNNNNNHFPVDGSDKVNQSQTCHIQLLESATQAL
jgi:hypothetical protein